MTSSVSSGGFTFSHDSVGGSWYWTVQANNIQGLGQLYQVTDILTPYGRFIDAQIPLPGDVVSEMAASLLQIQQQLSAFVSLVGSTPTSYAVTVTEGDAAQVLALVPVTNTGAFGSFLTVSATPDSPWLSSVPSQQTGIGKNQQAQFSVRINPAIMLATSSPYAGHLILQDVNGSSSVTLTTNVTVLPKPAIGISVPTVNLTYNVGTSSVGGAQTSSVSNAGPSSSLLSFTAAKIQNQSPWLAFTPSSGGPLASGASSVLTFSLISVSLPSIPGVYTEIIAIASRTASNSPQQILVQLTVT